MRRQLAWKHSGKLPEGRKRGAFLFKIVKKIKKRDGYEESKFKDIPHKAEREGEKAQGHCTSDGDGHPRTWEREPCTRTFDSAPADERIKIEFGLSIR